MNFHEGDQVMHWTFGLGKIIQVDEKEITGKTALYYQVQIGDMTVWVPANDVDQQRLRYPTTKDEFDDLFAILSGTAEPLPENRQERRVMLIEMLKDGHAESLCRVIRNLTAYQSKHPLNDSDQALLHRAKKVLFGEWSYSLSISPAQAEFDLNQILLIGH